MAARLSLQQVQHAVAAGYGCKTWRELTRRVEEELAFDQRVARVAAAFVAKGPEHDSTKSEWRERQRRRHAEVLGSDDAFRITVAFAQSRQARLRREAAVLFSLMPDERVVPELVRLLADRAKAVRMQALRWYARRLHPVPDLAPVSWSLATPADHVSAGVHLVLPFATDSDPKFRKEAICILGAYMGLGDAEVERALGAALDDPDHGVAHAAARLRGAECRKCGVTPGLSQYVPT